MRTIKTTIGTPLEIDDEPQLLDLLEAIDAVVESKSSDFSTKDSVEEIRFLVEQLTSDEAKSFLREFMQFALLRYYDDVREGERLAKRAK
jgi:uncharacterized protein YecA (UPF0149 family)